MSDDAAAERTAFVEVVSDDADERGGNARATELLQPASPRRPAQDDSGRVRRGVWLWPAEAWELAEARTRWARWWDRVIPVDWLTSARYLVLARKVRRRWTLAGDQPWRVVPTPEARNAFLAPRRRAQAPGDLQVRLLAALDGQERGVSDFDGVRPDAAYRALRRLEARGLVASRLVGLGGFPARRFRAFKKAATP